MDLATIKSFHNACLLAKRIAELTAGLPANLPPHYLYTIDAIMSIKEEAGSVRTTDIALSVSKQTAARYVNELQRDKLVIKTAVPNCRHSHIALSKKGEKYYSDHIVTLNKKLVHLFGSISKTDMQICVSTIQQAFYLLTSAFPGI